ncbi:MAG: hypothetical protein ACOYN0_05425 [Phycisphaerales bacterium]
MPPSQLNTVLAHFFDPNQTLASIAAALDETEDLILRRAALRATAAIESVLTQLQALQPLPAEPSQADTDRHRKNLDATRRSADLLRKTLAPTRAAAHRMPCVASPASRPVNRTPSPRGG